MDCRITRNVEKLHHFLLTRLKLGYVQMFSEGEMRLIDSLLDQVNKRKDILTAIVISFFQTSNPTPVHSHGMFGVNLSTWLGSLGLCLTYVIVLLQFRISEK